MNYEIIGRKVKEIREKQLKQTQEEFADLIGVSVNTIRRMENATSNVNNIEIYLEICKLSGYTMEELLSENTDNIHSKRMKRKINYILNSLTLEELDYVYFSLTKFLSIFHKDKIRMFKNVKKGKKYKEVL